MNENIFPIAIINFELLCTLDWRKTDLRKQNCAANNDGSGFKGISSVCEKIFAWKFIRNNFPEMFNEKLIRNSFFSWELTNVTSQTPARGGRIEIVQYNLNK